MFRNLFKVISMVVFTMFFSMTTFAHIPENQAKNIDTFVQKFVQAYENRSVDALIKFYHPDAMVIGTGQDEIFRGHKMIADAFKRDFAESQQSHIQVKRIAVEVKNNVAFASYDLKVNVQLPNSKPFESELRFSCALVKDHNQWFIIQSHLSMPLANQKPGESFPKS